MSKFEAQQADGLDLKIIRILKAATHMEILDLIETELGAAPTRYVIWELFPGSLQLLSTDDLKDLIRSRRDTFQTRAGGCTVLVAHDPSERTLMKWYATFAERAVDADVAFRVADSLDEAMSLIKELREQN